MSNHENRKEAHPESQRALNRLLAVTQYSLAGYLLGSLASERQHLGLLTRLTIPGSTLAREWYLEDV